MEAINEPCLDEGLIGVEIDGEVEVVADELVGR